MQTNLCKTHANCAFRHYFYVISIPTPFVLCGPKIKKIYLRSVRLLLDMCLKRQMHIYIYTLSQSIVRLKSRFALCLAVTQMHRCQLPIISSQFALNEQAMFKVSVIFAWPGNRPNISRISPEKIFHDEMFRWEQHTKNTPTI